jgi:murein L,D-transpeptidase YcbB/YkuD
LEVIHIKRILIASMLFWSAGFMPAVGFYAETLSDQVRERLRERVEMTPTCPVVPVGDEICYSSRVLPHFYERRAYRAAWSDDRGPLLQIQQALIKAIQFAALEGLRPADYHLASIEGLLAKVGQSQKGKQPLNPTTLADLDLLLTDAFLMYASHLSVGRVDPETVDTNWFAISGETDLTEVLETALHTQNIQGALEKLLPLDPGYMKLKQVLVRYRDIVVRGDWPAVPSGPKLKQGDQDGRVKALRSRLAAEGFMEPNTSGSGDLFDQALDQAVRTFQQSHGLDVDGAIGPATLAALNVAAEKRMRQIEVNLERWRWLPRDLGRRYIILNIADFRLDVVENIKSVLHMRAVVGKPYQRTPVFTGTMIYLVFNPYWNVPPRIASKELVLKIKKDNSYLAREHMKLIHGWGADAEVVDPRIIDWTRVTPKNFGYRLRQDPGPKNALGRVKFMFPNRFDVYLHDTPSRELFKKTVRGFSHGCIRIENPTELAEYVLKGDPHWTRENILAAIESSVEKTVQLPEPIPVHVLYWTAWVSEDGTVQFRNDIYERDEEVARALHKRPPTS